MEKGEEGNPGRGDKQSGVPVCSGNSPGKDVLSSLLLLIFYDD